MGALSSVKLKRAILPRQNGNSYTLIKTQAVMPHSVSMPPKLLRKCAIKHVQNSFYSTQLFTFKDMQCKSLPQNSK